MCRYGWLHWWLAGGEGRASSRVTKRKLGETAWEDLLIWMDNAIFLRKRGQHVRPELLNWGILCLAVTSFQDMLDASDLKKCISRSVSGQLEKPSGHCWEWWVHLKYHFHLECFEILLRKLCEQGVHHSHQELISKGNLCKRSPEKGKGPQSLSEIQAT